MPAALRFSVEVGNYVMALANQRNEEKTMDQTFDKCNERAGVQYSGADHPAV